MNLSRHLALAFSEYRRTYSHFRKWQNRFSVLRRECNYDAHSPGASTRCLASIKVVAPRRRFMYVAFIKIDSHYCRAVIVSASLVVVATYSQCGESVLPFFFFCAITDDDADDPHWRATYLVVICLHLKVYDVLWATERSLVFGNQTRMGILFGLERRVCFVKDAHTPLPPILLSMKHVAKIKRRPFSFLLFPTLDCCRGGVYLCAVCCETQSRHFDHSTCLCNMERKKKYKTVL